MSILEIRDLTVAYHSERGVVRAVDGVSLDVEPAQHLGIIGESGCGKTTLIRAIVRVLPTTAQILGGQILFKGRDLVQLSESEMRGLRWREIATIPQASMDSLDPVQTVGKQLETIMTVRGTLDRQAARRRAVDLFELVGLDTEGLGRYPHEFSGGMKQRAVIAMALALNPSLLIADEPVTALDVIVQHQVLEVLQRLEEELDLTVLLITHDISVVAQVCDSVAVMYAGQIVEQCKAGPFFASPYHPYSLGLQNAFPNLVKPKDVLISIEGYPPDLVDPPKACRFAVRCPFVQPQCHEVDPALRQIGAGHVVSCLRAEEMPPLRPLAADPHLWLAAEVTRDLVEVESLPGISLPDPYIASLLTPNGDRPLVEVRGVTKQYKIGAGMAGLLRGQRPQTVHAVNNISFSLKRGESLGLAGESGCGKTTTGKLLVQLLAPTSGQILFDGQEVATLDKEAMKQFRRRAQFMFQNPFEALSPRFSLYRSLSEPLLIHGWKDESARRKRILETLDHVNLHPAEFFLDKYPHQLSGGQLQRVVLARSLVLHPDFLVADEPVSMLDVSVRAGILNTMRDLAREMGLATIYISHDLSLLQYTCDRIAVMYLGQIVEIGPSQQVIQNPQHPYTQALVSAVPVPDPTLPRPEPQIGEGRPRATDIPTGCLFQERCPRVMQVCREELPTLVAVGQKQYSACHLHTMHGASGAEADFRSSQ